MINTCMFLILELSYILALTFESYLCILVSSIQISFAIFFSLVIFLSNSCDTSSLI